MTWHKLSTFEAFVKKHQRWSVERCAEIRCADRSLQFREHQENSWMDTRTLDIGRIELKIVLY